MTVPEPTRILVVDDEEAILETMTFTFRDSYEVLTSNNARRALEILDEAAPVAVVITDQRMPSMSGVEFLAQVLDKHPETVRIMLTGFADVDATVAAINAGKVYAYVNKPWEPDELKQIVMRGVEHHRLTLENARLLDDVRRTNYFLEGVMDRLDTGAIAVDADGVVQAANRPAREYLRLKEAPAGMKLDGLLSRDDLQDFRAAVRRLGDEEDSSYEDLDLKIDGVAQRLRLSSQTLTDPANEPLGLVVLFKEISHEPLRRRFDEIVIDVGQSEGDLRGRIERALEEVRSVADDVRATGIASPSMAELSERASRSQTAMQNWLDVDELLVREDYPDAQLLLDRMRVAIQRWPEPEALPERVRELAARVEAYYETGENSKQRVL